MDDYKQFIKYKIVSERKCIIIPSEGVDTEYYKPLAKKESDNFKFLLIARLLWDKGVGEYVEAAKIIKANPEFKNVEFLLLLGYIDEGNPSGIKKDLIDKWNTSNIIRYLGKVEDTREIIGEVDCVVLPSYREGVPRTLLEAASMEKPLIASDSIGCKDVVEDNYNGFLCNIKDSEDLADKMKKMLHLSKTELNVLGKNGRIKILKEFDEGLVIGIYKNEINGLGIGKV